MRISDWSSDVCSSDLAQLHRTCAGVRDTRRRAARAGARLAPARPEPPARRRRPRQPAAAAPVGKHHRRGEAAGAGRAAADRRTAQRSEEHTSELQSLMRISYAVFCLKKKKKPSKITKTHITRIPNTNKI